MVRRTLATFRHSPIIDAVKDETVKEKAMQLIGTETDYRYRKKYAGVWKIERSPSG